MMTRASIHEAFVSAFHRGENQGPVDFAEIQRIERELVTVLPQSYVTFMQTYGSIHTPSLLELIVDGMHDMRDVMVISEVDEVIDGTKAYWSAGMSEQLVGFASDSMGNLFCFRRVPHGANRMDDVEVWFFDHDFCREKRIAASFDEWLASFLKLKPAA
jgi:hypothetical protein